MGSFDIYWKDLLLNQSNLVVMISVISGALIFFTILTKSIRDESCPRRIDTYENEKSSLLKSSLTLMKIWSVLPFFSNEVESVESSNTNVIILINLCNFRHDQHNERKHESSQKKREQLHRNSKNEENHSVTEHVISECYVTYT